MPLRGYGVPIATLRPSRRAIGDSGYLSRLLPVSRGKFHLRSLCSGLPSRLNRGTAYVRNWVQNLRSCTSTTIGLTGRGSRQHSSVSPVAGKLGSKRGKAPSPLGMRTEDWRHTSSAAGSTAFWAVDLDQKSCTRHGCWPAVKDYPSNS